MGRRRLAATTAQPTGAGCPFPSATNFDSAASSAAPLACVWVVVGCADSSAFSFAADADVHDATRCRYEWQMTRGCLAPSAAMRSRCGVS